MNEFSCPIQLRWSDLDPNFHVRHSVYYDWGAQARVAFLEAHGLTTAVMQKLGFGPILFREECVFRKEIRSGDEIRVDVQAIRSRPDFSRWSFRHRIVKADGTLCAVLTVDGAWMDVTKRKLAAPPAIAMEVFEKMPKSDDFEWA